MSSSLIGLILFCFTATATPGPNNLMLLSSGLNFGIKRSLNHILGITFGFMVMMLLVGYGVGTVLKTQPAVKNLLIVFSLLMVTYLSYRIATSKPLDTEEADQKATQPIGFLTAALFQWVNPKAWAVGLTAASLYIDTDSFTQTLMIALIFGGVTLPVTILWTLLGQRLRAVLQSPNILRAFNITMGVAMFLSVFLSLVSSDSISF